MFNVAFSSDALEPIKERVLDQFKMVARSTEDLMNLPKDCYICTIGGTFDENPLDPFGLFSQWNPDERVSEFQALRPCRKCAKRVLFHFIDKPGFLELGDILCNFSIFNPVYARYFFSDSNNFRQIMNVLLHRCRIINRCLYDKQRGAFNVYMTNLDCVRSIALFVNTVALNQYRVSRSSWIALARHFETSRRILLWEIFSAMIDMQVLLYDISHRSNKNSPSMLQDSLLHIMIALCIILMVGMKRLNHCKRLMRRTHELVLNEWNRVRFLPEMCEMTLSMMIFMLTFNTKDIVNAHKSLWKKINREYRNIK